MNCLLCAGQGHHWTRCPLFGKPDEFIRAFAPKPLSPEEMGVKAKPRAALAPNFEESFGRDKEQALADILDDSGTSPEERQLALELLIGTKHMDKLDDQDKSVADSMHHKLLFGSPRAPDVPAPRRVMPTRDAQKDSDYYSTVNYDQDRDPGVTPE